MGRLLIALATLALGPLGFAGCAARDDSPRFAVGPTQPAADAELSRIDSAIRRFSGDKAGRLPASLDELTTERSPDGDTYLARVSRDPWGRAYAYAPLRARGAYDLRSYGADTLPATADDVMLAPRAYP